MCFMHQSALIILLAIMIVATIGTFFSAYCDNNASPKWAVFVCLFLTLFLAIWEIGVLTRPLKIHSEKCYEIKTINILNDIRCNRQVVIYTDASGHLQTLNVNQYFGCIAPKQVCIKHTIYADGPYCGVSFSGTSRYPKEKFELELKPWLPSTEISTTK